MTYEDELNSIMTFAGVTFILTYPGRWDPLWGLGWLMVFAVLVLLYGMVYGGE